MERILSLLAIAIALAALGMAIVAVLNPVYETVFQWVFYLSIYALTGIFLVIGYCRKTTRLIELATYFAGLLLIIVMIVLDLWLF